MSGGGRLPGGGGLMRPPGPMELRGPNEVEDLAVVRPMPIVSVGGELTAPLPGLNPSGMDALIAAGGIVTQPFPSALAPIPTHWRMSSSLAPHVAPLASGVPIIPPTDGSPFTIGYSPGSSLLLNRGMATPALNPTCATIYRTSQGWIVVDGSVDADGNITPGSSGVYVNGSPVHGFAPIGANDTIQIPDAVGNPATGHSFVFVDPDATAVARLPPAGALDLGEPWFRNRDTDGVIVATGSFRGIIDKYDENQDRMAFRTLPDGSLMLMAIDGMGGHDSGERAAEVGRRAFYDSADSGMNLEETIESMNLDMYEDNVANHTHGGAVLAGVHLHNDGELEVRTVGDAEVVVMSLPADLSGDLRLDYWSTRPSLAQMANYNIPILSDGRVAPGWESVVRLDPGSNVVDHAAGPRPSTRDSQTIDRVATEPGRIYLTLPMSDGLAEQYLNHGEMMAVVQNYVRSTGDVSSTGIRDALLRDGLIRCSLARMASRERRPIDITPARFRQAYREMTLEMDGVASDPPANMAAWTYQSGTNADGTQQHYFLVPFSGTAYLVRGAEVTGRGWMPDPYVVDPASGSLRFNPAEVYHPSVVGRFKQDNISLGVAAFVREP